MKVNRLSLLTMLLLLSTRAIAAQATNAHHDIELTVSDTPASPDNGGPLNWEISGVSHTLNLREQPSTTSRVIISYPLGTILDNLGCQRINTKVWCDVQRLGGGPRGYASAIYLTPALSPGGGIVLGPDTSALRAGQSEFDTTGTISCAQFIDQPMTQCEYGVARNGGGYATVVITRPDKRTRAIFFRRGKPVGADTSQADGYPKFHATKENDLHLVHVGNERYEIQDVIVLGR